MLVLSFTSRNGPSEFYITGSLRTWSVISSLSSISCPTLVLNGAYDEVQDSCVAPFFEHIPRVKWCVLAESSHMGQYEERNRYMQIVRDFLNQ